MERESRTPRKWKDAETAAGNGAKRTRKQHSGDWQDLAGPGWTGGHNGPHVETCVQPARLEIPDREK